MNESNPAAYRVYVDDNFHYMDPDERYPAGAFPDCESARRQCISIVESSLQDQFKPGMTAAELLSRYHSFGEDPWISSPDPDCKFSAWTYAEQRVTEICGERGA